MSSLEIVAAPWRAKALRASVLPAPMPPVIATATGRDGDPPSGRKRPPWRLLLVGFGGSRGRLALGVARARLVRGLGVCLDALVDELLRQIRLGRLRGLSARRFHGFGLGFGGSHRWLSLFFCCYAVGCFAFAKRSLRLGEDLLGEVEIRCSLDRLRIVGARDDSPALDALEREREAASLAVDLDDLGLDLVSLRDDLSRVLDVMLRELGDVHQPFDSRQDLDEGAEGDDLRHLPLDLVALAVGVQHLLPGVGLRLLEAERDALSLAVDVEHLDLHVLADLEHLGGMVDVTPGELADVDETVHAIQVDEGAEVHDVRDLAVDDVARIEPVEDLLPLLLALVLEHCAAREHDVVPGAVQLDHLRAQLLAEKLVEILDAAEVDQRGGPGASG